MEGGVFIGKFLSLIIKWFIGFGGSLDLASGWGNPKVSELEDEINIS